MAALLVPVQTVARLPWRRGRPFSCAPNARAQPRRAHLAPLEPATTTRPDTCSQTQLCFPHQPLHLPALPYPPTALSGAPVGLAGDTAQLKGAAQGARRLAEARAALSTLQCYDVEGEQLSGWLATLRHPRSGSSTSGALAPALPGRLYTCESLYRHFGLTQKLDELEAEAAAQMRVQASVARIYARSVWLPKRSCTSTAIHTQRKQTNKAWQPLTDPKHPCTETKRGQQCATRGCSARTALAATQPSLVLATMAGRTRIAQKR